MTNIDHEPDPALESRLRDWGQWAREAAPRWQPAAPSVRGPRRQRTWSALLVAAAVVVAAGLTAAGPRLFSHHSTAKPAAGGQFPAVLDSALSTTETLPDTGATLSPPPAGAQQTASIGWQQAMDACQSGALCFTNLTAQVYFANFTKADAQPQPVPAWIIDYRGASCVPLGQPPTSTIVPSAHGCRVLNVIDPTSGAVRWSFRVPTS